MSWLNKSINFEGNFAADMEELDVFKTLLGNKEQLVNQVVKMNCLKKIDMV